MEFSSSQSGGVIDRNLLIIFAVTLTAVMGVSSIAPAFPLFTEVFEVSRDRVGLLITVFTVPGVFLTPFLGVAADRWGRKVVLVPSLALFGLAGISCAFAPDFTWLLVLRTLQGVGGAALGSINVTLIGDLWQGRERTTAFGYNASVLSVGTASYPTIGGFLAEFGWFFPFFLPAFGLIAGLLVVFLLDNPEPEHDQHLIDYIKQTVDSISSRQVLALFVGSVLTFVILYGAYLNFFPLLIKDRFDISPGFIGLLMSTVSISSAIASSQIGRVAKYIPERTQMLIGLGLYVLAMGSIPFVDNVWLMLVPTVLYGVGNGWNIPNLINLLSGLAPIEQRAAFMSLNGMVLRLGQTLGPLVMGLVYSRFSMEAVFFTGVGFAVLLFGLIITQVQVGTEPHGPEEQPVE